LREQELRRYHQRSGQFGLLLLALGALEQLAYEHVGWQVFGCVLEGVSAAQLEPELFCVEPNGLEALNVGHG